jgi:hypothetical protein
MSFDQLAEVFEVSLRLVLKKGVLRTVGELYVDVSQFGDGVGELQYVLVGLYQPSPGLLEFFLVIPIVVVQGVEKEGGGVIRVVDLVEQLLHVFYFLFRKVEFLFETVDVVPQDLLHRHCVVVLGDGNVSFEVCFDVESFL